MKPRTHPQAFLHQNWIFYYLSSSTERLGDGGPPSDEIHRVADSVVHCARYHERSRSVSHSTATLTTPLDLNVCDS